jgi:hypothetical protein
MEPAPDNSTETGDANLKPEDAVKPEPIEATPTPPKVPPPPPSPVPSIPSDTESDCSSDEDDDRRGPLFNYAKPPITPPQKPTKTTDPASRKRGLMPQSPHLPRVLKLKADPLIPQPVRPHDSDLVRTILSPIKSQAMVADKPETEDTTMDVTEPADGSADLSMELDSPLNKTINPAVTPQNVPDNPAPADLTVTPAFFAGPVNPVNAPVARTEQGN